MSLTLEDIRIIKGLLMEQENRLVERFEDRFDGIDKRFDSIDKKLSSMGIVLDELVEIVPVEYNERYSNHERRIISLEKQRAS